MVEKDVHPADSALHGVKKILQVSAHEQLMMTYFKHFNDFHLSFDYVLRKGGVDFRFKGDDAFDGELFYITPMQESVLRWALDLRAIIVRKKYRVVHFHLGWASIFGLFACCGSGVKAITHIHSLQKSSSQLNALVRALVKPIINMLSWRILACSADAAAQISYQGRGKILPNAIDYEKYKFNPKSRLRIRSELGVIKKTVFVHIGNFYKPKNHIFLIKVFQEIKKKYSDAFLVMAGADYGTMSSVMSVVKNLSLSDDVLFLGSREDVPDVLSASDVFLFPSLFEGAPISLIEAQVNGLPSIFSKQISNDIVISDFCFPCRITESDIESWVVAVDKCINFGLDESSRAERSSSIAPLFDVRIVAHELEDIYLRAFDE